MVIWNSKFGNNLYSNFEVKSKALPKFNFGQTTYCLRSQESNASNDT